MGRFLVFAAGLAMAAPASAQWSYEANEGGYYAWITDGGFVENSYDNGLKVFCPDLSPSDLDPSDTRPRQVLCEFRVTLDGDYPRPPAAVTFTFDDGTVMSRLSESVSGGKPQIGLEGELLEALFSKSSVTVSTANGSSHTFSLTGSSTALRSAMGL